MPSKYEVSSEELVPAIRSMMAKALVEKHKLREASVAEVLGVTQAAVSKYLHTKSERIEDQIRELEKDMGKRQELLEGYVKKIAEGKLEYAEICICAICRSASDVPCSFSKAGT